MTQASQLMQRKDRAARRRCWVTRAAGHLSCRTLVEMFSGKRQTGQPVPSDWQRINLTERLDVAYWCRSLSCSQAELEEAIHAVGPLVTDVRSWLVRKR